MLTQAAPLLPSRCAHCAVRDRALCSALSDAELAHLADAARIRTLAPGEPLLFAGEDAPLCGNLIDGALKLTAHTATGAEQTVALLFAGDFVGDVWAGTATHDVTAIAETRLCLFPRAAFADAVDRHPLMERLMLKRTLASLEEARARMTLLARGSAEARVASLLLRFAPAGGRFELPISRGDMAAALGLTIESVSRALTKLRADGVLDTSGRRGAHVPNVAALKARAVV